METKPKAYVQALFEGARNADKINHYFKFKKVHARLAEEGEIVHTIINGEEETKNTAKKGDILVRSTGKNHEEYIIPGEKFKKRYELDKDSEPDGDGCRLYNPTGDCWAFVYHGENFSFVAPWDEDMIVKNGDFIASTDEHKLDDIYRIEKDEFVDTYKKEIKKEAKGCCGESCK